MSQSALSSEVLIAVAAVAVVVLLVALYAIAKGRGFQFSAKRGDSQMTLDVSQKPETASASAGDPIGSKAPGVIDNVSVLNQGKVNQSTVSVQIGHVVGKSEK